MTDVRVDLPGGTAMVSWPAMRASTYGSQDRRRRCLPDRSTFNGMYGSSTMTTSQARGIKQDGLNDASVAEYLQTYPDFFERNSPLLAKLRLPHLRDVGATVSLVERQVEVLRERNQSLERKLKELVDVARANDALADRIHRLSQRLIRAHTLLETINAVETSLREDFDAMHSVLVLFLEQARIPGGGGGPVPAIRPIRPTPTSRRSNRCCNPASRAADRFAMRSATISSARTRSRSARWRSRPWVRRASWAFWRSAPAMPSASIRP